MQEFSDAWPADCYGTVKFLIPTIDIDIVCVIFVTSILRIQVMTPFFRWFKFTLKPPI